MFCEHREDELFSDPFDEDDGTTPKTTTEQAA
jgi:hypothetical protein